MESMGVQGEWTSLSGTYTSEEADFMAQLLSNFSVPNRDSSIGSLQTTSWPGHELTRVMAAGNNEGSNFSLEISNSNLNRFSSQGSSSSYNSTNNGPSIHFPTCHKMLVANNSSATTTSIDFGMGFGDLQDTNSYLIRSENDCLNQLGMSDGNMEEEEEEEEEEESGNVIPQQNLQLAKKYDMVTASEIIIEEKVTTPSTKRSRSSSGNVQTDKRKTKAKKSQKPASTSNINEEESNAGLNRQSSSGCSSGDDSIDASQDLSGGGVTSSLSPTESLHLNSTRKTRARRGSATDPQSLYARKRRERINEKLKILQNLVPNGTKVDISTMLEEAVLYVKFLQVQIKLLSSDDLWMYAPIAYNGKELDLI